MHLFRADFSFVFFHSSFLNSLANFKLLWHLFLTIETGECESPPNRETSSRQQHIDPFARFFLPSSSFFFPFWNQRNLNFWRSLKKVPIRVIIQTHKHTRPYFLILIFTLRKNKCFNRFFLFLFPFFYFNDRVNLVSCLATHKPGAVASLHAIS